MPLFSIVLPTYNRPEMLRRAVASVRRQDFDDYELIVVDDGSDEPYAVALTGLRTARDLLLREFRVGGRSERISAVGGPLASLLRLTTYLEAEGVRDQLPAIHFVQSTSEYMTSRARRRLEAFWRCPVEDRFGVSESILGAWRCHSCGAFHFEPYGVPEVVGFDDAEPRASGKGRLVLTGFYPFMQMTPLIRYVTGDAVEIVRDCPTGEMGTRLLGRIGRSALRGSRLVLGDYEVIDILDDEPEVYRQRPFVSLPYTMHDIGSPPVFSFSDAQEQLRIDVAIRYDPLQFPESADVLRRRLEQHFTQRAGEPCTVHLVMGAEQAGIHMF